MRVADEYLGRHLSLFLLTWPFQFQPDTAFTSLSQTDGPRSGDSTPPPIRNAANAVYLVGMVELSAIAIIDRIIQLINVRERNRERYFNNFIEPLYKDVEAVTKDYMALFAELLHRLLATATTEEIITWLEERRTAFQPVRMKLRALLPRYHGFFIDDGVFILLKKARGEPPSMPLEEQLELYKHMPEHEQKLLAEKLFEQMNTPNKLDAPSPQERFVIGIWGILKGRASISEVHDDVGVARLPEYKCYQHPILSLLKDFGSEDLDENIDVGPQGTRRSLAVQRVRSQQKALERAWMDVITGYAELRQVHLR